MNRDDPNAASEQPTDDFTAIRGIGRETARRLHEASVRTFADLAGYSSSEIATKARVSVQRVERDDWIGQARELAEVPSPASAEEPETPSGNGEHPESFLLRLTLDDDNRVIRTVVQHATSKREGPPWVGWDTGRLLEFLSEYVDLAGEGDGMPTGDAASASEPEPAHPATATTGELEPALPTPPSPGKIRLREVDVISTASGTPQWSLKAGEPFAVRLAFDLQGAPSSGAPLGYTVGIFARTVGESRRQTRAVGEDKGTLGETGEFTLEIRSTGLPLGTYRLEGALRLYEPSSSTPHRLVALEGGLLEVTDR